MAGSFNLTKLDRIAEQQAALHFARQHDWGQNATLDTANDQIHGIEIAVVKPDYTVDIQTKSCPATIAGVRAIGGY